MPWTKVYITGLARYTHEVNQGIAFARTLRALEADDFRSSKLWLLVAAILVAAWVWWIVSAGVLPLRHVHLSNGREGPRSAALR